jgi:hypothetical protein
MLAAAVGSWGVSVLAVTLSMNSFIAKAKQKALYKAVEQQCPVKIHVFVVLFRPVSVGWPG